MSRGAFGVVQRMAEAAETSLRGALRACRGLIGWTVLFSAGINLLYLAPSIFMMQVYDRVLNTGGMMTLMLLSAVLVFALVVMALLDMTRTRVNMRLSLRLNRLLAPVVVGLGMQRGTGNDAARVQAVRDFDMMRQVFTSPAATAVLDTPWTIVFVAVCFFIHPYIGALTLAGGVVLLLIALRHEQVLRPVITEAATLAPRYYSGQDADRAAADSARALGMRGALIARHLTWRNELLENQTRTTFVQSAYGSLSRWWRLILQSAVLGLGAYLAVNQQISPGALIAGSILAARALAPLEQVVGGWRQIEQARVAYKSLVALIDGAPEDRNFTALPAPTGQLSFENISVRLPGANRFALGRVSFSVTPGEVFAVIGSSGAGKSALARTAVGAIAPEGGSVRIDGANIADWDPDKLGPYIGYMPQEVQLVAATVAENIRRFSPATATTDSMIVEAAQAAGVHELILRLPNAYDTVLGPGGRGVSLGQGQRIALARALYGNPPLLVLDEPNAHIDGEGEIALVQAIRAAAQRGAAVLLVAHKPTVLATADRILILRDGVVEVTGPRDEIARKFMRPVETDNTTPLRARESQ
jgi:PrtD family type I secretion system ABC transporter